MRLFNRPAQIAVLATVALHFLVWPVWRMPFPMEIAPIEGWCAYFADAAGGADFLYPQPGQLIVDNYPPLSFYLLGYGEKLFGDALYLGRILSLLATLGTGTLIYRVVRQLGASRGPAAVAGVWFIAVMAESFYRYVGVNDPQMVADVVMPKLSGPEMAERLKARFPALRVLYMSGYTDDAMLRHGLLEAAVSYIQKPFTPLGLDSQGARSARRARLNRAGPRAGLAAATLFSPPGLRPAGLADCAGVSVSASRA